MNKNIIYYTMIGGGFADIQVREFLKKWDEVHKEWADFTHKYGAVEYYAGGRLQGLLFEKNDAPNGWLSTGKLPRNAYRPQRRKACMEAYNHFKALSSRPNGMLLSRMLKIAFVVEGNRVITPSFEHVGDEIILSLHKKSELPDGTEAISMSEYWTLKEAA